MSRRAAAVQLPPEAKPSRPSILDELAAAGDELDAHRNANRSAVLEQTLAAASRKVAQAVEQLAVARYIASGLGLPEQAEDEACVAEHMLRDAVEILTTFTPKPPFSPRLVRTLEEFHHGHARELADLREQRRHEAELAATTDRIAVRANPLKGGKVLLVCDLCARAETPPEPAPVDPPPPPPAAS